MSVELDASKFSDEEVTNVIKALTIVPKDPNEGKFKFGPKRPTKTIVPVGVYHLLPDNKTLRVPYRVGCALTGKMMNHDKPHIKFIVNGVPEFKVSFRENQKPLMKLAWEQIMTYSTTTLGVPPGTGKCLDPQTPLRMFNGSVKLAMDMRKGDALFNDEGEKTTILSTCTGIQEMFNIIPYKGRSFKCNLEHMLTLKVRDEEEAVDISVKDYLETDQKFKEDCYLYHVGVDYPNVDVEADPYLYGYFNIGVIGRRYVINSRKVRLSVLAGYMDSRGFVNGKKVTVPYKSSIEEIALSLGLMAYKVKGDLCIEGKLNDIPSQDTIYPNTYNATCQRFRVIGCGKGKYSGFTLDGNGRFLLSDYTVTHNTIMGAALSHLAGYNTLVLCNRISIAEQWRKTFLKCYPGYGSWIWVVGVDPEPPYIPPFIISLDTRCHKIPDRFCTAVGTLIVDEAHLFCTPKKVECLLRVQPRVVIIETATLVRNDGMHEMVQSIAGTHGVFTISNAPYVVKRVLTQIPIEVVKNRYGNDYTEMCREMKDSQPRNEMICDIVATNLHRKYIILARRADHVVVLQNMFEAMGIKSGTLYGTKNKYNDSSVLIGTMPKIGTGFDEENACEDFKGDKSNVLILANSVKQYQSFEQYRGRVMRCKSPIVIWIQDPISTINNHFRGLVPWIEETNGTIEKMRYIKGQFKLPIENMTPAVQPLPTITTSVPIEMTTDEKKALAKNKRMEKSRIDADISTIPTFN
jgi:hypothetical protein